ncbi:MAG: extracellular solute-binding protein [Candidatus Pacebacteria bacterium]|jgi:multiple sugar transport system substrate-binding protein|nr:extracellular solute-binding protein [Candidatus Paceibacterota bacterium]
MKITVFQVVILIVFILSAVVAVTFFALGGGRGGGGQEEVGRVEIWGTYDQGAFQRISQVFNENTDDFDGVSYVEKNEATFTDELVEALASGRGPDLFFLEHPLILRHRDKIIPIPFDIVSRRAFRDMYVEASELFVDPEGVIALPTSADPLVLYWNRSIFSNEGVSSPPRFWDEVLVLATDRLNVRDDTGNVSQSAIALGEYQNIDNAKEILSMLIMQAGGGVVASNEAGELFSQLNIRFQNGISPAESALRLYTDFANPIKPVYSWNRGFRSAKEEFLSGSLAMYIGFASELRDIRLRNPNLNFDVAPVPQSRDGGTVTFGNVVGLAIPKNSENINGAARIAISLSSTFGNEVFTDILGLTPARRDLLVAPPSEDLFKKVFFDAALIARAWLDPNIGRTNSMFKDMIELTTSGRLRVGEAVGGADSTMESLLR